MERLKTKEVEKPLITEEVMEQLEIISSICEWGDNGSKPLSALYKEIQNGESIVYLDNAGNIIRNISYVGIEVYFTTDSRIFRLYEDHQEFKNGFIKVRESQTEGVFEKMMIDEDPIVAGFRGIKEELGINARGVHLSAKKDNPQIFPPKNSKTYPGVLSVHTKHSLCAIIDRDSFKPEGYVEHQEDKTTYFKWELLHDFGSC